MCQIDINRPALRAWATATAFFAGRGQAWSTRFGSAFKATAGAAVHFVPWFTSEECSFTPGFTFDASGDAPAIGAGCFQWAILKERKSSNRRIITFSYNRIAYFD
jgi:hypothetical protein